MPRKPANLAVNLLVVIFGLEVSLFAGLGHLYATGELTARDAGSFLAVSPKEDPYGYAAYPNRPKKLDRTMPPEALSLQAIPGEAVPFGDSNRGFALILTNTTSLAKSFAATDGRMNIVREALDAGGVWQPIENMPFVHCGNSYHRVVLPSGHYWSFSVPEYTGSMRTRMRFVLRAEWDGNRIYSNEFEGSIHPDQFTLDSAERLTR